MSLIGTRIGPYEVHALIGAGGMGEVYRAHDTILRRDVAVKALPPGFGVDPERVTRFEREARILAGLNHPAIATIHGLERIGEARFIVLELIDGGTLEDRIAGGPLPAADAIRIARDVADALHAAHETGVVHRDLKPSNIALTAAGRPKVLDFGLAKAVIASTGGTTVAGVTVEGAVLGTAPYMSPEQARGAAVDKRTDVWSFGCVLYEMLTGQRAFPGATASDVFVAILEREPDFTRLPAAAPPSIQRLLQRCLAKDVRQRLHDLADARIELDDAIAHPHAPAEHARAERSWRAREIAAWVVTVVAVLAAGAAWASRPRERPAPAASAVLRLPLAMPRDVRFTASDPATRFAISPDGTRLALVAAHASGVPMLWIRPLDGGEAYPLAGTEGASFPFWSPDSSSIAYISRPVSGGDIGGGGRLFRVDLAGGAPTKLADQVFNASGAWGADGVILFTPAGNAPLHRVSATAPAAPTPVGALEASVGDVQHSFPSFLPDGRRFVYTALGTLEGSNEARGIYLGSLDGGAPRLLISDVSLARYANEHLVFLREATLFAQRFDPVTATLEGDARPIAEQLQIMTRLSGGTGAFSVADTGVIVFQTGVGVRSQLAWIDRRTKALTPVGEPADYGDVRLSPDGTRAAVSMLDPQLGTRDLWIFDLARGVRQRFTVEPADEYAPVWSPDGNRLAYTSTRDGSIQIYEDSLGRPGQPRLVDSGGSPLGKYAADWSPDGGWLVFIAGGRALARSDLHKVPMSPGGKSTPLVATGFIETQARFAPDGKWIAYVANDTNRLEVYVRPFPEGAPRLISLAGGSWPAWRKDGREIFFVAPGGALMAVTLSLGDPVQVGAPRELFSVRLRPMGRLDASTYDVSDDGQRFLMNTFVEEATSTGLTLLVNWPAAVR